jgi:hypothetical protein
MDVVAVTCDIHALTLAHSLCTFYHGTQKYHSVLIEKAQKEISTIS